MAQDPLKVACWRFEQIAPLLEHCLSEKQRSSLIDELSQQAVRWPSGRDGPIGRSTLYDWLRDYQARPHIETLFPRRYRTLTRQSCITQEWIDYALALLEEEPSRSIYILCRRIKDRFNMSDLPSRSSLYRALIRESRYQIVRRTRTRRRHERFQAAHIHQIWQGDAKADFDVTFTNNTRRRVRILSVLDDCSRAVLAARIVDTESTGAVVSSFCSAVARYGLSLSFYADRGSAYDSDIFRQGLAVLGVRRINTRPRNPAAHGKIEAYHRTLQRWFINELRHQLVQDATHLQMLLDGFIEELYNKHYHREIRQTPREALGTAAPFRTASLQQLCQAFVTTSLQKPDAKTGSVVMGGLRWRVPSQYLLPRQRLRIVRSILDSSQIYLVVEKTGEYIQLASAVRIVPSSLQSDTIASQPLPAGPLSQLLETYRGRSLPQAVAGFGLPEIYHCFSVALDRPVPDTEKEADVVLRWLKKYGPFTRDAFNAAIDATLKRLGQGRSLTQMLEELTRIINRNNQGEKP